MIFILMKLESNELRGLSNAVSLAPSNLIARERIDLIRKAFTGDNRTLEYFLRNLEFDGCSHIYSVSTVSKMANYGRLSNNGDEALFPYLRVVSQDFDLSQDHQVPHKEFIDSFLNKYQ